MPLVIQIRQREKYRELITRQERIAKAPVIRLTSTCLKDGGVHLTKIGSRLGIEIYTPHGLFYKLCGVS